MRVQNGQVILGSTVKGYFHFVAERHAIYLRRKRGDEFPWSTDPILTQYKFTNIFRELDTGTVYCRKSIREPYANHPELFFNVALYRLFNWIPTYKAILEFHGFVENYNAKRLEVMLRERKKRGIQIFTGAHMITGTLGGDKIHQVVDICLQHLWDHRRELEPVPGDTLQQAFNRLNKHCPGYGPFISYEVITDLRWTRYLCKAKDIDTWANPGPGACRGINRLQQLPVRPFRQLSSEQYIEQMRKLLSMSTKYLPEWVPTMEMRDIEHSLCEFDKYERARLGHGRPRQKFVPPHLRPS